jgi:16S rRNA (uracil1498-N3)-methyltransferase
MQIFYSREISGDSAVFDREESGHCIRVLRMRRGDGITFTDGRGNLYEGVITSDDHTAMKASISSVRADPASRGYSLHIAISPLKNDDRLEWFIEKSVEAGIDRITPIICTRSEKKKIRRERLQSIMLSAMKQSARCLLPQLDEPQTLEEFLLDMTDHRKLIATCESTIERTAITEAFSRGDSVTVLIGPEGDFTPEEIASAVKAGYRPVHLGTGRLRTETAGIAACCSVCLANI